MDIAGNKFIVLDSNIVLDNVVNSTGVDMQAHARLRWQNKDPVEVLGQ